MNSCFSGRGAERKMGDETAQPAVESAKTNRRFLFIPIRFGYTGAMKEGAR